MQSKADIDEILRQKSETKEIPGVVAIAAATTAPSHAKTRHACIVVESQRNTHVYITWESSPRGSVRRDRDEGDGEVVVYVARRLFRRHVFVARRYFVKQCKIPARLCVNVYTAVGWGRSRRAIHHLVGVDRVSAASAGQSCPAHTCTAGQHGSARVEADFALL